MRTFKKCVIYVLYSYSTLEIVGGVKLSRDPRGSGKSLGQLLDCLENTYNNTFIINGISYLYHGLQLDPKFKLCLKKNI